MSEGTNAKPSKVVDEFTELYCKIIEKLCGEKSREFLDKVKLALGDIRQLKHNIRKSNKVFYEVNYRKAETRCAYIYAYSILNTAIVYWEIMKHLEQKKDEFRELFSKKTLNLCCLAGGPATEAVAVSKAINDFTGKFCSDDTQLFTDVHVTVVDICQEWRSEAHDVVSALNDAASLFRYRKVCFQSDFVAVDLLQTFQKSLQAKIKEADIVTVVKFSNAVQESSAVNCAHPMRKMMGRVIRSMDYDSCLFMLDTAGGLMVNKVMAATKGKSSSECQLSLHQEYCFRIKMFMKMSEAIGFKRCFQYKTLQPTRICKVSSSMWIKKPLAVQDKPPAVQEKPPAVQENPPAVQENPPAVRGKPAVREKPPVVREKPPAVREKPPAVKKNPPAVKKNPPAVQKKSTAVQKKSTAFQNNLDSKVAMDDDNGCK